MEKVGPSAVFSKSPIEIADKEIPSYQLEPINTRPPLTPLTPQFVNFAKSLSDSIVERISKSHTPKISKTTITRPTGMRVLTDKTSRELLFNEMAAKENKIIETLKKKENIALKRQQKEEENAKKKEIA